MKFVNIEEKEEKLDALFFFKSQMFKEGGEVRN